MAVDRIKDGVVVSITYVLTVEGQEEERVEADDPLEYLHGAWNIVPGLEAALAGKKVGDKISVTLSPEEAYGEYHEDNVESIEREDIPDADALKPGMVVEIEDDEGYIFDATVLEVNDKAVVLDFNPPLAGKTVSYTVEVVALREAEAEELEHGHPHSLNADFEDYEDFDEDDDEEYDDEGDDFEDDEAYDEEDDQ
jgi:FKBP-type peptidyl-prolyl cis-trans isomerase SlyD